MELFSESARLGTSGVTISPKTFGIKNATPALIIDINVSNLPNVTNLFLKFKKNYFLISYFIRRHVV
jgi:hypothetical protein